MSAGVSRNRAVADRTLVISASGCSADEGRVTRTPVTNPVCAEAGAICTDNTICGETGCEPVFDRTYQVRVASIWTRAREMVNAPTIGTACFPA